MRKEIRYRTIYAVEFDYWVACTCRTPTQLGTCSQHGKKHVATVLFVVWIRYTRKEIRYRTIAEFDYWVTRIYPGGLPVSRAFSIDSL